MREGARAGRGVYQPKLLLDGAQARGLFAEGAFELIEPRGDVSVRVFDGAFVTTTAFVRRRRVFVFRHRNSVGKEGAGAVATETAAVAG